MIYHIYRTLSCGHARDNERATTEELARELVSLVDMGEDLDGAVIAVHRRGKRERFKIAVKDGAVTLEARPDPIRWGGA